jgi:hypothetical protein
MLRALLIITCTIALTVAIGETPGDAELGPLKDYFYDCVGAHTSHRQHVRGVIKRALAGDRSAMRTLTLHRGLFGTGDNEGYSEISMALLRSVGDSRYAAFVADESAGVQREALDAFGLERFPEFDRKFPKTARLYHAHLGR